jgi:hypothetical protein
LNFPRNTRAKDTFQFPRSRLFETWPVAKRL